jgi:hypothetical protein
MESHQLTNSIPSFVSWEDDPDHGRFSSNKNTEEIARLLSKQINPFLDDSESSDEEEKGDAQGSADHKPALLTVLKTLNNDLDQFNAEMVLAEINKILAIPMGMKREHKLAIILNELEKIEFLKENDCLQRITNNILVILLEHADNINHISYARVELLNKALTQLRFIRHRVYQNTNARIDDFKRQYKLKWSDRLFRNLFAFNIGLGTGSTIFGITLSILLNPITLGVSGGLSIILTIFVAILFLRSNKAEDQKLATSVEQDEVNIRKLAIDEANLRMECYEHIVKIRNLLINDHTNHDKDNPQSYPLEDSRFIEMLINNKESSEKKNILKEIDHYIEATLANYTSDMSVLGRLKKNSLPPKPEVELIPSKHRDPVLSFFGVGGTVFGLTKATLVLCGIVAIGGSTAGLGLVIAGAAIAIGLCMSVLHWKFNQRSAKRKELLNHYRQSEIDKIKIRSELLTILKNDLRFMHSATKDAIKSREIHQLAPELARRVSQEINSAEQDFSATLINSPSSNSTLSAKGGLFSLHINTGKTDSNVNTFTPTLLNLSPTS